MDNKISAGSHDLNRWLSGGYERDIITTLYGGAGTGKTNFCILATVSQAKRGKKVIFIDTEGGFSSERVKQIMGDDYENVLENILLLKPISFEEQKKVFANLLEQIKSKGNIGLIVVDGMTMLYRLEIAEAKQHEDRWSVGKINGELAKQLRILAEISRKMDIPIIITNQVYANFLSQKAIDLGKEKEFQMVGGDLLKYWSKCIMELKNDYGRRKAILRKHRSLPEKELSFIINNAGVRRRGFF